MDGRTERCTDSPCILQDVFLFESSALLTYKTNNERTKRQDKGTADHVLPLGDWFLCIFMGKGDNEEEGTEGEEAEKKWRGKRRGMRKRRRRQRQKRIFYKFYPGFFVVSKGARRNDEGSEDEKD